MIYLMKTLFRQQNQVVVPTKQEELILESIPYVLSFAKNIEAYGFTASAALVQHLIGVPEEVFIPWAKTIESLISEEVGLRSDMTPLFPNFPQQVMDLEDSEWIYQSLCYYWSNGSYRPYTDDEHQTYQPLIPNQTFTLLELGTEEDYFQLFRDKISHSGSLNEDDLTYLNAMIQGYGEKVAAYFPEEIPNRETFAYLMISCLDSSVLWNQLKKYVKNPVDILRIQQGIETGNIHLDETYRFKGVKRSIRRQFMEMLDTMPPALLQENLWKREKMWKQWAEVTHTGEYQTKTPTVFRAFQTLREGKRPLSFQGKVNQLFEEKNHLEVSQLLMKRPTEMARALDRLLRLEYECFPLRENDLTSYRFGKVAHEVPSKVLIQVLTYFQQRSDLNGRYFQTKNGKVYGVDQPLEALPQAWIENVCRICECALMERYEQEEALETVYLDEALKQKTLPLVQRCSHAQLQPLAKGSRLPLEENTKVLRPFIYWKDPEQQVIDLDLSVAVLDERFTSLDYVYYGEPRSLKYGIWHSGDVRRGGDGATEYLEIDLEQLKSTDAKYLAVTVHSFSHVPFDQLPDAFAGVMERDGVTGEVFEPSTVRQKANLTQQTMSCLVFIYDVEKEELIWVDRSLDSNGRDLENITSSDLAIQFMLRSFIERQEPNLYHLLSLHVQARGATLVETEDEASIVFGGEAGLQPYQFDQILTHYVK